ncbi:LOW QUALITY PROTEIN: hypothetical protein QYF61_020470 [Mycteria americana]|uniref:Uncharacterized protein n=1 Tax=Mycteria americana TaxID=33587 RepID=A0AAN7RH53_MYCAM|nr:LOW QUALITY PROTEIN: hypothetical protein QYF61_020470 [Mycteria americana]
MPRQPHCFHDEVTPFVYDRRTVDGIYLHFSKTSGMVTLNILATRVWRDRQAVEQNTSWMMGLREQWGHTLPGGHWDTVGHCGTAQGTLLGPGQFYTCVRDLEEATLTTFVDAIKLGGRFLCLQIASRRRTVFTSYAGWSAWLHKQALISPKRSKRDGTVTNDLRALKHPLQSLSALGANQWLLSHILPQWGEEKEKDHQLIVDALAVTQNNVSLALSCVQAQLWMQSTVAAIKREGEEGTLPTEIQKVIWDNATELEKEFQPWWYPVHFTYDPTDGKATAFVLTIRNASVYAIYPIIVLGLNHNGAIRYPLEHRVWAQQNGNKWQTIDVKACVVREQQGFLCESNTLKAQDICLDTEQNGSDFEIQPDEAPETGLVCIGKGCACMRTFCDFVFVDHLTVAVSNHSNIWVCSFTRIMGCDFNCSAPVTTHQLLQADYTLDQDLLTPTTR